ncbi:TRIC cation channel family protein [Enemella dayhoffiae]|uniref:TRIC cation channel family protein n=1 Tax=Enemella dayhoffiae TaxID=2016507 RepID=UPI001E530CFA|nr:TRIC cation channel family protein [Enemella dayhoffiae]
MPDELSLAFRIIDLLGVALNGVLGGLIARQRRFDITGFAVLGIISGLGGGMIRDIAVGSVPEVFGGNRLYATPALLAAGLTVAGHSLALNGVLVMVVGVLAGSALAVIAHWRNWRLPVHGDGTVTMTRTQLASLVRRVERRTLRRRRRREQAED